MTAQFTIDSYTITFDKQSGTGGSDSVTATFGSAMPTASAPTRSGYVFAGYFDAVSGGAQYYSDSMTSSRNWDKSTNTILYARWTINQYTITFDGNGGGGHSPISVLANYNSTIALPSVPTRIGYTFVGWFTAISGGTQFTSSTVVTSSYIVYARWTANTYTLSFNAQGGTVSPASKLVIYNQEVGELPTPTKNGFSFEGWNTQADGNGSFYTLNTIYNINNNFTIYAIWGEIIGGPACGEITSITDSRDNNVYKVVGIGSQCWMKENLKYLPLVHSNTEFSTRGTSALPGYGVYNYNGSDVNTAKAQTNYLIYGVLYNWYAVNQVSICPTGWHVPSDNETKLLEGAVDSIYGIGDPVWDNTGYRGSDVGAKLAGEYNLWVDGNLRRNVNFGGSGFNFLPSGMRYSSGGFGSLGSFSGLWSSSTTGSSAWGRSFYSTDLTVRRLEVSFGSGLSVRCLKD